MLGCWRKVSWAKTSRGMMRVNIQQINEVLTVSAEQLSALCSKSEPQALANEIMMLIDRKSLSPGTRLPTVRSFAASMEIGTNAAAAVWSILRDAGYIETHRRGGSFVAAQQAPVNATNHDDIGVNLSHASGDPSQYPDLSQALSHGLNTSNLHGASLDYIIPPLRDHAAQAWPFSAEEWMVAGASSESVLLAVSALCPAGSNIAVEQPTSSRLLRILSLLKVEPVGVPWDEQGPDLQALEAALNQQVTAFIYQPRSHLPLGRSVSASRIQAMSQLLKNYPSVTVIEDDPLGPLADVDAVSIGKWLPQQTTLVRSYCKAFGLDLRSSIIGGSAKHIAAIRLKRSEGIGIISRILQGALHFLLTDVTSQSRMEEVRGRYALRRRLLQHALIHRGVTFNDQQNGLLLWLPVDNEARVVSALAAKNILVSEGSRHFIHADQPHIAVNIAVLPAEDHHIAAIAKNIATVLLNKRHDVFD